MLITFSGLHGVGKTTCINSLSQRFPYPVHEIGFQRVCDVDYTSSETIFTCHRYIYEMVSVSLARVLGASDRAQMTRDIVARYDAPLNYGLHLWLCADYDTHVKRLMKREGITSLKAFASDKSFGAINSLPDKAFFDGEFKAYFRELVAAGILCEIDANQGIFDVWKDVSVQIKAYIKSVRGGE